VIAARENRPINKNNNGPITRQPPPKNNNKGVALTTGKEQCHIITTRRIRKTKNKKSNDNVRSLRPKRIISPTRLFALNRFRS
jgi:hypothetical protein